MNSLESILLRIQKARDDYDTLKLSLLSEQSEILRTLSVCYSALTDYRIEYKDQFNSYYFNSTASSHNAREREAEMKCPELYKIRRVLESTRVLIESVRSTISNAKHDNV